MRRITNGLGILAAAGAISFLPAAGQAQVTLSATAGVTFASVAVGQTAEIGVEAFSMRRSSAGLKLAVPVGERFLFRADASYAQRGADFGLKLHEVAELPFPVGAANLRFQTTHLELASLFGARFGGPAATVYLLAGPSVAFELSCSAELEAVVGAAGFETGLGPLAVSLEGLYYLGLADIAHAPEEVFRHRGVSVRAGVGIPIG